MARWQWGWWRLGDTRICASLGILLPRKREHLHFQGSESCRALAQATQRIRVVRALSVQRVCGSISAGSPAVAVAGCQALGVVRLARCFSGHSLMLEGLALTTTEEGPETRVTQPTHWEAPLRLLMGRHAQEHLLCCVSLNGRPLLLPMLPVGQGGFRMMKMERSECRVGTRLPQGGSGRAPTAYMGNQARQAHAAWHRGEEDGPSVVSTAAPKGKRPKRTPGESGCRQLMALCVEHPGISTTPLWSLSPEPGQGRTALLLEWASLVVGPAAPLTLSVNRS